MKKKIKKESLSISKKVEEYALNDIKRKIKENPALSDQLSNAEKGVQNSASEIDD